MIRKTELLEKINAKGYIFQIHKHEALFTVEDSIHKRGFIKGAHTKNLFLKNKKNKFFLFSCIENTKIDLKKISKSLSLGNISFAKDQYLYSYLGVLPGSVTPFGLLNDKENEVEFYLDKNFLTEKTVNFHPLVNTLTLSLNLSDFINFLIENKKKVNIFDFDNYSLIDIKY